MELNNSLVNLVNRLFPGSLTRAYSNLAGWLAPGRLLAGGALHQCSIQVVGKAEENHIKNYYDDYGHFLCYNII